MVISILDMTMLVLVLMKLNVNSDGTRLNSSC